MKEIAIVVFAKEPQAGRVKTRLTPPLNPEEAMRWYEAFCRDTLAMVGRFVEEERASHRSVRTWLAWSGAREGKLFEDALDAGFEVIAQGEGDLGARMGRVVQSVREQGAETLLLLGTDAPTLSPEHLRTAVVMLRGQDVVFGPCFDGGYYLLGLGSRGPVREVEKVLFEGISWSTSSVLEQSWSRARAEGLLCEMLGFWYDVDTFEDLKRLRFHLMSYLSIREPDTARHTRALLESSPELTSHLEPSPSKEST
jgi:uncharacterized protein